MGHKTLFHLLGKGIALSVVILLRGSFSYGITNGNESIAHQAASQSMDSYVQKTQRICNGTQLCKKTTFNGSVDTKDEYMYLAIMNIVIQKVDKGLIGAGYDKVSTKLQEVVINTQGGERRGSANWNRITLNVSQIKSYDEFLQVFTHELGHIVDLGVVQGTHTRKDSYFTEFGRTVFAIDDPSFDYYSVSRYAEDTRRMGGKKQDFCSGYGMTNPFEDFAECFNLYVNHNEYFQTLAKTNTVLAQKYNNIDDMLGNNYLFATKTSYNIVEKYGNERRGRDTTRL